MLLHLLCSGHLDHTNIFHKAFSVFGIISFRWIPRNRRTRSKGTKNILKALDARCQTPCALKDLHKCPFPPASGRSALPLLPDVDQSDFLKTSCRYRGENGISLFTSVFLWYLCEGTLRKPSDCFGKQNLELSSWAKCARHGRGQMVAPEGNKWGMTVPAGLQLSWRILSPS